MTTRSGAAARFGRHPHPALSIVRGAGRWLWTFTRRQPLGAIGLFIIVSFSILAAFGPQIAPRDPVKYSPVPADRFHGPQWTHGYVLGSDNLGRDQLSRLIIGTRASMSIAVTAVAIGTAIGFILGLVSGFYPDWRDSLIQRLVEIKMSIPTLVLALTIVAVLGQSTKNVIIAIAFINIPGTARVVRSVVLTIRTMDYVQAAKAIGAPDQRIIFRHIAPQTFAPVLVLLTSALGLAIIIEASLSFLGLGTPDPNPSWGGMLSGPTLQYVERAPWNAVFPGVALTLLVFGFNLLGDALRDTLDPRLRR